MLGKQVMIKRTYYFPEDLCDRVKDYSNKTGLSISDIIRISVNTYLLTHPLENKKKGNKNG